MAHETKQKIYEAITEVYEKTTGEHHANEWTVVVPIKLYGVYSGERTVDVLITRVDNGGDSIYKLLMNSDEYPLVTAFGWWSREYVADVFMLAITKYYYDIYGWR